MEPTISIRAKESDASLVAEASVAAAKYYKEKSGTPVTFKVDKEHYLPANM